MVTTVAAAMSSWRSSSSSGHSKRSITFKTATSFSFFHHNHSNQNQNHKHSHDDNDNSHHNKQQQQQQHEDDSCSWLGILSFDTAKTFSRLISVYRSLSDYEINRLRKETMKSRGVFYLNSDDEGFLLNLACAERLEELDQVAAAVTRLGHRCSDLSLSQFDVVYRDMKLGLLDLDKLAQSYSSKDMEKSVEKLEKRIWYTSNLYAELETLTELEASERKINEWKRSVSLNDRNKGNNNNDDNDNNNNNNLNHNFIGNGRSRRNNNNSNFKMFEKKVGAQRKLVKNLKESSLWSKTFDKSVGLAARIICASYARICLNFGPYVGVLPCVSACVGGKGSARGGNHHHRRQNSRHSLQALHFAGQDRDTMKQLFEDPVEYATARRSDPIDINGRVNKASLVRFMSSDSSLFPDTLNIGFGVGFGIGSSIGAREYLNPADGNNININSFYSNHKNRVFQAAPPSSVGGSGLSLRYSKLITKANRFLKYDSVISDQEREDLYHLLPTSLRARVKSKLKKAWRKMELEAAAAATTTTVRTTNATAAAGFGSEGSMSTGWREAAEGIMQWLAPMARDTLTWHAERNLERQNFDAKATVLLLQTLHYSDLEKTEAAIVEVLVGLSYIYWFEHRRLLNPDSIY